MDNTLIVVLDEFLRLGAPQARKNSLTALSVLGNEESAKLIAKTALQDNDASVRERAVEEMTSLPEDWKKSALEEVAKGLLSDEQHQQQRAYMILGKFKSRGWDVPKIRMRWGNRMWLAASLYSSIYPQRHWWFRVRSWKPALLATAISILPFLIYNYKSSSFITGDGLIGNAIFVVVITLAGVITSVIATQFTTPIYLQLRPFAASVVQVLLTLLSTTLAALILLVLLVVLVLGRSDPLPSKVFGFVWLLPLTAAAIRVGTLLPLVRGQFVRITRNRKYNWFLETVFGFVPGFLIATFVYWSYKSELSYYYNYIGAPESTFQTYTATWLAALAIIIGIAYSFAKIDTEVLPDRHE